MKNYPLKMTADEYYMNHSLLLAAKSLRSAMPNPSVGATLVYNDTIIGEGATSPYGGFHAEVNAINAVKEEHKPLIKKATLYVTLEPCSHFGKTPPCANKIVEEGIPKVVIGIADPNTLVNGKGIRKLRENGVEVVQGILEAECYESNKRFFTFHKYKRPYIILKWAQTKKGFIDPLRTNNEKGISWISGPLTKKITHRWRTEEMAICVGTNTVETDNPMLTAREHPGPNPVRVVIDRNLRLDRACHVFNTDAETVIFNQIKDHKEHNLIYKKIDFDNFIAELLNTLYEMNLQSLIVEGGRTLLNSFIEKDCWDEARIITGATEFARGVPAPVLQASAKEAYKSGNDMIEIYVNN